MDKKKIITFLVVLTVLAVAGVLYLYIFSALNGRLSASGTIEAIEVEISAQVGGRIEQINIDEGASIKKGDLLVQIEKDALTAGYNRALAQVKMASSQAVVARKDFERIKSLYLQGMVSKQQYDTAFSMMQSSQANLDQAQAGADAMKIQLDNSSITAPIDGVVLVKAVEAGELSTPGMTLLTLADLKKVQLKVFIPEQKVGEIKLGQEAMVEVDSYRGQKFKGRVVNISDKAEFTPKNIQTKQERVNQVFAVKIDIPNLDYKLKPGMPADATF